MWLSVPKLPKFGATVSFLFVALIISSILSSPVLAMETTVKLFNFARDKPMYDTKLDVYPGDYLAFKVDGYGSAINPTGPPPPTVPWVSPYGDPGCVAPPTFILPNARCWSLIARIGDNLPFQVFEGGSLERGFYVQQTGRLYMAVNYDYPNHASIGSGGWWIRVIRNQNVPPPKVVPSPFLDLPWNYQDKLLSFGEAALAINSFFDHEYPLLSSGLGEPEYAAGTLGFDNEKPPKRAYSSHDGYDYGIPAEVENGDMVKAAAPGCATYKNDCAACGNAIVIDHGNYYQTRYYHLQPQDLITTLTTACTNVDQGDPIGKVGSTGRSTGPHIHFMVVEDKDHDGDFEDNIPDGVTDPYGWQSKADDPWPQYSFEYNNQWRNGNTSYYLWQQPLPNLEVEVKQIGGTTTLGKYKLTFPIDSSRVGLNLFLKQSPFSVMNDLIKSVLPTLEASAKNFFNMPIISLATPFTLNIDYTDADLSRFKPETVKIYSSSDGVNWQEEATNLNDITKTASATINHLSFFTLMAERLDTIAPVTQPQLSGDAGAPGWYKSDVGLTLNATDNEGGLGVYYTGYKVGNEAWQEYATPLAFNNGGNYQIEFYSVDNDENQEEVKKVEFGIDKTPPTATYILTGEGGQGNTYPGDVNLSITTTDNENGSGIEKIQYRLGEDEWQQYLESLVFTNEGIYQIEFYSQDKAGNIEITQAASFVIDKGPPEIEAVYDLDKHTLAFSGLDVSATTVDLHGLGSNDQEVVITDVVDNATTLTFKSWEKSRLKFYAFKSISYNQQPKTEFTDNLLSTIQLMNSKTQATSSFNQTWWVKDEILLNLLYLAKNNTTYIRIKRPSAKLQTETREGVVFLKLTTDKGLLKYSY